jgi:hypothetical protein
MAVVTLRGEGRFDSPLIFPSPARQAPAKQG